MYPKLEQFRGIKQRLDPKGLLSSSMARRLGIVEK
jgi:FAD/FMN-containing dehydrogenase